MIIWSDASVSINDKLRMGSVSGSRKMTHANIIFISIGGSLTPWGHYLTELRLNINRVQSSSAFFSGRNESVFEKKQVKVMDEGIRRKGDGKMTRTVSRWLDRLFFHTLITFDIQMTWFICWIYIRELKYVTEMFSSMKCRLMKPPKVIFLSFHSSLFVPFSRFS